MACCRGMLIFRKETPGILCFYYAVMYRLLDVIRCAGILHTMTMGYGY
jgi:hypothetical protein